MPNSPLTDAELNEYSYQRRLQDTLDRLDALEGGRLNGLPMAEALKLPDYGMGTNTPAPATVPTPATSPSLSRGALEGAPINRAQTPVQEEPHAAPPRIRQAPAPAPVRLEPLSEQPSVQSIVRPKPEAAQTEVPRLAHPVSASPTPAPTITPTPTPTPTPTATPEPVQTANPLARQLSPADQERIRIRDEREARIESRFTELKKRDEENKLGLKEAWSETKANPTEVLPFIGGAKEGYDLYKLYEAANALESGEVTDSDDPRMKLLVDFKHKQDEQERRGTTVLYRTERILAQLPAFAGEMAATAGIYSGGKAAMLAIVKKAAGKAVTKKILGKLGERAGLSAAESAASRALMRHASWMAGEAIAKNAGTKTAGWAVGAGAQMTLGMPHRLIDNTLQNMLSDDEGHLRYEIGRDEMGQMRAQITNPGQSFGTAFWRAFKNQWVEVASERMGYLVKKVPVQKILQGMRLSFVGRWFARDASRTVPDFLKMMKDKTAWNGLIGEWMEERFGEAMRAGLQLGPYQPLGMDLSKLDHNQLREGLRQATAEGLAFAIPGAAGNLISGGYAKFGPKQRAPMLSPELRTSGLAEPMQFDPSMNLVDALAPRAGLLPEEARTSDLNQPGGEAPGFSLVDIARGLQPPAAPGVPQAAPEPGSAPESSIETPKVQNPATGQETAFQIESTLEGGEPNGQVVQEGQKAVVEPTAANVPPTENLPDGIRYDGTMQTPKGPVWQYTDVGGTGSTFYVHPEGLYTAHRSLDEAIASVSERFAKPETKQPYNGPERRKKSRGQEQQTEATELKTLRLAKPLAEMNPDELMQLRDTIRRQGREGAVEDVTRIQAELDTRHPADVDEGDTEAPVLAGSKAEAVPDIAPEQPVKPGPTSFVLRSRNGTATFPAHGEVISVGDVHDSLKDVTLYMHKSADASSETWVVSDAVTGGRLVSGDDQGALMKRLREILKSQPNREMLFKEIAKWADKPTNNVPIPEGAKQFIKGKPGARNQLSSKDALRYTSAEWLEATRFYRSGKTKNAELPTGERVMLVKKATASNFREISRAFLLERHRISIKWAVENVEPQLIERRVIESYAGEPWADKWLAGNGGTPTDKGQTPPVKPAPPSDNQAKQEGEEAPKDEAKAGATRKGEKSAVGAVPQNEGQGLRPAFAKATEGEGGQALNARNEPETDLLGDAVDAKSGMTDAEMARVVGERKDLLNEYEATETTPDKDKEFNDRWNETNRIAATNQDQWKRVGGDDNTTIDLESALDKRMTANYEASRSTQKLSKEDRANEEIRKQLADTKADDEYDREHPVKTETGISDEENNRLAVEMNKKVEQGIKERHLTAPMNVEERAAIENVPENLRAAILTKVTLPDGFDLDALVASPVDFESLNGPGILSTKRLTANQIKSGIEAGLINRKSLQLTRKGLDAWKALQRQRARELTGVLSPPRPDELNQSLTFGQILKKVVKNKRNRKLLNTALKTGYLTDGRIAVKMSDQELAAARIEANRLGIDAKKDATIGIKELIDDLQKDVNENPIRVDPHAVATDGRGNKKYLVLRDDRGKLHHINQEYYATMLRRDPNATWTTAKSREEGRERPILVTDAKGKTVGIVMLVKVDEIEVNEPLSSRIRDRETGESVKVEPFGTKGKVTRGGGGGGGSSANMPEAPSSETADMPARPRHKAPPKDTGEKKKDSQGFADIAQVLPFMDEIRPAEMTELVQLVTELLGDVPTLKKLRGALGQMRHNGAGLAQILLRPELAKTPEVAAKVLAHEIGHAIDLLPDHTLSRGNLLGRLRSLRGFMRSTFGGISPRNKDIRAELYGLSQAWRPFEDDGSAYAKTRKRGRELYADFVSVLLNNPGLAQKLAPESYQMFMDNLAAKPEVKTAYYALQELLHQGSRETVDARLERLSEGAKAGEAKRRQLEAEAGAQKSAGEVIKEIITNSQVAWVDQNKAILNFMTKAVDEKTMPASINPRFLLEEAGYADARNHELLRRMHRDVMKPFLDETKLSDEQARDFFHKYLFYKRILAGDRSEVFNPGGENPSTARVGLERLHELVNEAGGEGAWRSLERVMAKFHEIAYEMNVEAVNAGVYSAEQVKTMTENKDAYATFEVLDFMDRTISAGMKHQTGTFKAIGNTFSATLLKLSTLNRLIAYNKAKASTVNMLKRFKGDIEKSAEIKTPEGRSAGWKPNKDPRLSGRIELLEDGKMVGYDVDPYIAKAFDRTRPEDTALFFKALSWANHKGFHPLYVIYSLGFQFKNFWRDLKRSWKSGTKLGDIVRGYIENAGPAWRRANGIDDAMVSAAIEAAALDVPFSEAFGQIGSEDTYERLLRRMALGFEEGGRHNRKGLAKLMLPLDAIQTLGDFIEAMPKVSGFAIRRRAQIREHVGAFLEHDLKGLRENSVARALSLGRIDGRWIWTEEARGRFFEIMDKFVLEGVRDKGIPNSVYERFMDSWLARWNVTKHDVAYQVRNYVGTPNWRRKGTHTYISNALMMYSNVALQGYRADWALATDPTTRAGWWVKTFTLDIMPKLVMAAAVYGAFGPEPKKWLSKVSDYNKLNYTPIPLGYYTGPDGKKKAVYIPIPSDEAGRFIGGLAWRLLNIPKNGVSVKTMMDTFDFGADQFPGMSPIAELAASWAVYLRGGNPTNPFTQRPVISRENMDAGGAAAAGDMMDWTVQKFGGVGTMARDLFKVAQHNDKLGSTKEAAVKLLPGVSALIKVSNFGETEEEWRLEDLERQDRARFRKSLPSSARELTKLHSRLMQMGERRSSAEERDYEDLGEFLGEYKGLRADILEAEEKGMKEKADRLRDDLDRAARRRKALLRTR